MCDYSQLVRWIAAQLRDAMARKSAHQRFVAWLAMAALWLTIVAPVVSRTLPDAQSMPDLGAWCTSHGLSDHHPPAPSAPPMHMDDCGYCTLLGHSPLVSSHAIVFLAPPSPPAPSLVPWATGARYVEPVLSANPRGPPLPGQS